MRYGCCLNMVARNGRGIGDEYLETLDRLGYDYAELPLAEIMELNEGEFTGILKRQEKLRIHCEACNNFFPSYMRLTGRTANIDRNLDYVERALNRAEMLGAQYIVFGSGPAKSVPEGFPLEEGYLQIRKLLKKIGPMAQKKGIVICIEPLRREECNLINTFAEAYGLAREVGHPAVKGLIDYYHMTSENEPAEHIEIYGRGFLKHVHFARYQGRRFPSDFQQDREGYKAFAKALNKISYDGRISCEAYSGNFLADASAALVFMKQYINNKIWEEEIYV